MALMDITKVKEEAEKEFKAERMEEVKKKIKLKFSAIEAAELVVRNLKRELDDLMVKATE